MTTNIQEQQFDFAKISTMQVLNTNKSLREVIFPFNQHKRCSDIKINFW